MVYITLYLSAYSNTIKTIFATKISVQFKMPCVWTIRPAQNSRASVQISQIRKYLPISPHLETSE